MRSPYSSAYATRSYTVSVMSYGAGKIVPKAVFNVVVE